MNGPGVIGTWADVFGPIDPQLSEIAEALAQAIRAIDPHTVEVARPGDRAVSFGVGPKKMSQAYLYLMPQKDRINLGFYQGAALNDPNGLLEGTGKALRHVKIFDLAQVDQPGLQQLLQDAIYKLRQD